MPKVSGRDIKQLLAERTRELSDSVQQQRATAEILRVISNSPSDIEPVFTTIARHAASLCRSLFANVFVYDGEFLQYVASHATKRSYVDLLAKKYPMRPDRSQISGRVVITRSIVCLEDARADPHYDQQFPDAMGWRRMLGVPLQQNGKVLGAIVVGWADAGKVRDTHIRLLMTFADQAVIALEHVRLFQETEERSRQLAIANKFKSRFLSTASHDLRQPLHALNLFVAQLRSESDVRQRDHLLLRVDEAIHAMNELLESLLDMSKLEAGVVEPNLTEFPIQKIFQCLEVTFAVEAHRKGLRLAVVPAGAEVRSDFILLERMLLNLVSNAVRYTERGGLVVGARRRGSRLRIDIIDTGDGIAQSEQTKIFREFYQAELGETVPHEGLGLGLSIVDRLGQLLGHQIELESRVGHGSRFSVFVPLGINNGAHVETPTLQITITDHLAGAFVLVIDDDELVLDGMYRILRGWGCDVLPVQSAQEALAELSNGALKPHLIISDFRLVDGQTGMDAIRKVCQHFESEIPSFLISGDTEPKRLKEASASGYHLLAKPVLPMVLRAMCNRMLAAQATKL